MEKEFIVSDFAEHNPTNLVPKIKASRYDDKSSRFYFFTDPHTGEKRSAIGITTLLSKVTPESPFLTEWKLKYGQNWKEVLNLTADYGTIMHIGAAHILQNKTMPEEALFEQARAVIAKLQKFEKRTPSNMMEKNMISFAKFVKDYNVEPLLIEALLVYQTPDGEYYCLTEDILCSVSYTKKWKELEQVGEYVKGEKKGQPKYENVEKSEDVKEIWCVDMKSNYKNGSTRDFFEEHKFQLIATKRAVFQNFGIIADKVLDWAPLGWSSKEKMGAYVLKEWNIDDKDIELLDIYERLAHLHGYFRPSGKIERFNMLAETTEEMYQEYSYLEFVEKVMQEVE
jgi:hypothetical protein